MTDHLGDHKPKETLTEARVEIGLFGKPPEAGDLDLLAVGISGRETRDWRDMDLILLAKIVRMEADIRTAQTELDDVGMMVENKRGTPIPKSAAAGH